VPYTHSGLFLKNGLQGKRGLTLDKTLTLISFSLKIFFISRYHFLSQRGRGIIANGFHRSDSWKVGFRLKLQTLM
jgi:hypothetical protein